MSQGYPTASHAAVEIEADEEDDLVAISGHGQDKGKGRETLAAPSSSSSSTGARAPSPNNLSGKIGGSTSGSSSQKALRTQIAGLNIETRYSGVNSLDESVGESILRDLRAIYNKVVQVLRPTSQNAVLRDWDLWGPLLFTITLAILLSLDAPPAQSLTVFTGVFVIVSVGSVVVTLNCKLLGGKVSFLQSLCVLGYCLFPLDIAALVATFVRILWVRIPVCIVCFAWSVFAIINFLGGTRLEDSRAFLAVYPAILLFFCLAWITMLS